MDKEKLGEFGSELMDAIEDHLNSYDGRPLPLFWDEMKVCVFKCPDGKPAKCIDPYRHNLGCVACPVEGGIYGPVPFEEGKEK